MKIIKYILVLASFVLFFSCGSDTTFEPFDHAGQAIKDEATIQEFLETHFYIPPTLEENFGVVDTILNGETPLLNEVTTQEVKYNDIDYKIYYLKNLPEGINESPTKVDSAEVNYKGILLNIEKKVFEKNSSYTFWGNLYDKVIPGWKYALPHFKAGINTGELPLRFEQTGKGVIFIPSGLAYRNIGSASIPANTPLMFHVEMAMVHRNDHDVDGIKSMFEDINNDDDYSNDDTDGDGIANFLDSDDDGDGVLTKDENVDPNGDGNPDDALDSDGDNIPDYLDAN